MTHHINRVAARLSVSVPRVIRNRHAAIAVRQVLVAFDGIADVDVDAGTGRVTITYDRNMLSIDHVLHLLSSTGYATHKSTRAKRTTAHTEAWPTGIAP
jgi:copper chaperone CopZ